MRMEKFKQFLYQERKYTSKGEEKLTEGAINARISRAGRIEKELEISLDEAVKDINSFKQLKKTIKTNYPPNVSSTLYNTATRYFKFTHGVEPEKKYKEFLKL